ncbi:MAG: MAG6790 family protein [Metamycoplasmataceae bacterium]
MYQYKAVLSSNKEVLTKDHTIEDIEKFVVGWRRRNTEKANENIEIIHVYRNNKLSWRPKEELVKII